MDNSSVRASVNTFAPGDYSGEHEHRYPRFVLVIDGGTLESIDAAGAASESTLESGSCTYRAPIRHTVRNKGKTTATLLEVELKGALGPDDGVQPCPPQAGPAGSAKVGSAAPVRRTLMLVGPDLIVTRIEFKSGARERVDRTRAPRLVYVQSGGSLETRERGGTRSVATQGAALWVDSGVSVGAQDHGDVVAIEIEPQPSGAGSGYSPPRSRSGPDASGLPSGSRQ